MASWLVPLRPCCVKIQALLLAPLANMRPGIMARSASALASAEKFCSTSFLVCTPSWSSSSTTTGDETQHPILCIQHFQNSSCNGAALLSPPMYNNILTLTRVTHHLYTASAMYDLALYTRELRATTTTTTSSESATQHQYKATLTVSRLGNERNMLRILQKITSFSCTQKEQVPILAVSSST